MRAERIWVRDKSRGPNIGLAGCGIRVKIKAGYGMTEILWQGCGIKTFRREREFAHFDRRDEEWT